MFIKIEFCVEQNTKVLHQFRKGKRIIANCLHLVVCLNSGGNENLMITKAVLVISVRLLISLGDPVEYLLLCLDINCAYSG